MAMILGDLLGRCCPGAVPYITAVILVAVIMLASGGLVVIFTRK